MWKLLPKVVKIQYCESLGNLRSFFDAGSICCCYFYFHYLTVSIYLVLTLCQARHCIFLTYSNQAAPFKKNIFLYIILSFKIFILLKKVFRAKKQIQNHWLGLGRSLGEGRSMSELRFQTEFKSYKKKNGGQTDKSLHSDNHIIGRQWLQGRNQDLSFNPGLDFVTGKINCPKVSETRVRM